MTSCFRGPHFCRCSYIMCSKGMARSGGHSVEYTNSQFGGGGDRCQCTCVCIIFTQRSALFILHITFSRSAPTIELKPAELLEKSQFITFYLCIVFLQQMSCIHSYLDLSDRPRPQGSGTLADGMCGSHRRCSGLLLLHSMSKQHQFLFTKSSWGPHKRG